MCNGRHNIWVMENKFEDIKRSIDILTFDELRELNNIISIKLENDENSPSNMMKKGLEWMQSPEGIEHMRNHFENKAKIESHQFQRIEKYFNSLNSQQLDEWIPKFLKWEEEYEEFQYTERHVITSSNIFSTVLDVLKKYGSEHDVDDYDEDFLSGVFTWGNYTFKLYCGQGCFWRIQDNDGKIIFQTT